MNRRTDFLLVAFIIAIAAIASACSGTNPSITAPSAVVPEGAQASSGSDSGSDGGDDTIRVRCERRGTRRSKASIDGNNLASGSYRARLTSGANSVTSPARNTVGDEVEFDFDSNRNDIAEGATPIARTFIQDGRATGELLNANGQVVASETVACEVR